MNQELWNLLFGFTGKRCFLPEGCSPPPLGILIYIVLITALLATGYYLYTEHLQKLR
jgi:hypothetical protein